MQCYTDRMNDIDEIEVQMNLTAQEADLIRAIRNFRAAYPNGKTELKRFARQLLSELLNP